MWSEKGRPDGCPFEAYGSSPEMLKNLTCENCIVSSMVCEYRGYAAVIDLAKKISPDKTMHITTQL